MMRPVNQAHVLVGAQSLLVAVVRLHRKPQKPACPKKSTYKMYKQYRQGLMSVTDLIRLAVLITNTEEGASW